MKQFTPSTAIDNYTAAIVIGTKGAMLISGLLKYYYTSDLGIINLEAAISELTSLYPVL